MQVKALKDFFWSHSGRLSKYCANQIAEVHSKVAEDMVKFGYAEFYKPEAVTSIVRAPAVEKKMQDHEVVENKMMSVKVNNKKKGK